MKRKILLQDWIGSKPNVGLVRKEMVEVDKSNYFGSYTSSGGHTSDKISSHL